MDGYPISLETKEKREKAFALEANLSMPIKVLERKGKDTLSTIGKLELTVLLLLAMQNRSESLHS